MFTGIFILLIGLSFLIKGLTIQLNEKTTEKYKIKTPGLSPAMHKYLLIISGVFFIVLGSVVLLFYFNILI